MTSKTEDKRTPLIRLPSFASLYDWYARISYLYLRSCVHVMCQTYRFNMHQQAVRVRRRHNIKRHHTTRATKKAGASVITGRDRHHSATIHEPPIILNLQCQPSLPAAAIIIRLQDINRDPPQSPPQSSLTNNQSLINTQYHTYHSSSIIYHHSPSTHQSQSAPV